MSDKFEYKYNAPTIEERKEIDSIRNQYLPKTKEESKLEKLRKLDNKVKNAPMIVGLSFGVVGILLFGTGLTFFLEWTSFWFLGIPFGLIGCIMCALAYPLYCKTFTKLKNKYGQQIIELSNELLNEE